MALPTEPLTLEVAQVEDLARHFSAFRHDVNGCLSLIVAATELIRYNPDVVKRMAATLVEQPPRIAGKTREFAEECERVLGILGNAESAWYLDLWKRHNAAPGDVTDSSPVPPETVKNLHGELLALGKELMQMGFVISGARVLTAADGTSADDVTLTAVEQLPKVTRRFNQLAEALETALHINPPPPRRLASGAPSGPISLSPEKVALFHRRLSNLQSDLNEHLKPLLELSRLARNDPKQVQTRAQEFSQQPPKISAEINRFATDFDSTFGIVRTGG